MPKGPKATEEKIQRMLNAWETLAPGKTFGGMTYEQFKAIAKVSLDARAHIKDLEDQRTKAISDREDADDIFEQKAQLVVNGVLADPTEGPDSALYESFGYTPKSDRRSGLTRKRKTPSKS